MCKYCDINSGDCEYFADFDGVFYQDVTTDEWDSYDDDYVHMHIYGAKYCQYCGGKLDAPQDIQINT